MGQFNQAPSCKAPKGPEGPPGTGRIKGSGSFIRTDNPTITRAGIGTGTTAPATTLEVAGTTAGQRFEDRDASRFLVDPSNSSTAGAFHGNVAIGTTTAKAKRTVNGGIESKSGGVKFPDGTTRATAMPPSLTRTTTPFGTTPGFVGQLFVRTTAGGVAWIACGTTSVACW